jgi:hypothetical protein
MGREPKAVAEAAQASRELVELLAELGFRRVNELVSVETVETKEVSNVVLRLSPFDVRELLDALRKDRFYEQQSVRGE